MKKYLKGILIGLSVLVLVFALSMISGINDQSAPSVANTISSTGGTTINTITVNAGDDLATDDRVFILNSLVGSTLSNPNVTYSWDVVQKQGRVIISGDNTSSPIIKVYKDAEFIFSLTANDGRNTATDYITVRVGIGPFPETSAAKPGTCPAGFAPVDDYYFQQVDCWAQCGGSLPDDAIIHSKLGGYYSAEPNYFNNGSDTWVYKNVDEDYKWMQSDLDNELIGCEFTCPRGLFWNGSSCSDQQTFPNPTVNLTASDTLIDLGQSSTLSWTSTNAISCTGYNFNTNNSTSGSTTVTPSQTGTIGYAVNCTNGSQTASASTTISVSDSNPNPLPLPVVNLTADPQTINLGDSTTLVWLTANVSSCTSNNFDIAGQSNGSTTITPSQTGVLEYSLTCNNNDGDSATDTAVVTVNQLAPPPPGACSYPEGMYNTFSFSSMSKNSLGEYDLKSTMPVYKLVRTDGSFTSNFAYPIGTWNGLALFIGYGADYVETLDGSRYPVIVQWTDMTYPMQSGHNQRVFAVDMPLSEVEPYILPLMTFHNNDSFTTPNDNVLLGDMQWEEEVLLGNAMRWNVPLGSEYSETNWIYKGSNGTNIEGGDSFEPGFYIEDGKIIGIVGYNYAANSYVAITTTPWLVRRLSSMVGAEWTERSITNPDTGKCLPLAPLPDFSGMAQPSKYVRNSTVYNQVINN